jgi:hypothetical protein
MPSPWIKVGTHPVEIEYVKKNIVGEHVKCHAPCTIPDVSGRRGRCANDVPRPRRSINPFLGKSRSAMLRFSMEKAWRISFRRSLRSSRLSYYSDVINKPPRHTVENTSRIIMRTPPSFRKCARTTPYDNWVVIVSEPVEF